MKPIDSNVTGGGYNDANVAEYPRSHAKETRLMTKLTGLLISSLCSLSYLMTTVLADPPPQPRELIFVEPGPGTKLTEAIYKIGGRAIVQRDAEEFFTTLTSESWPRVRVLARHDGLPRTYHEALRQYVASGCGDVVLELWRDSEPAPLAPDRAVIAPTMRIVWLAGSPGVAAKTTWTYAHVKSRDPVFTLEHELDGYVIPEFPPLSNYTVEWELAPSAYEALSVAASQPPPSPTTIVPPLPIAPGTHVSMQDCVNSAFVSMDSCDSTYSTDVAVCQAISGAGGTNPNPVNFANCRKGAILAYDHCLDSVIYRFRNCLDMVPPTPQP